MTFSTSDAYLSDIRVGIACLLIDFGIATTGSLSLVHHGRNWAWVPGGSLATRTGHIDGSGRIKGLVIVGTVDYFEHGYENANAEIETTNMFDDGLLSKKASID